MIQIYKKKIELDIIDSQIGNNYWKNHKNKIIEAIKEIIFSFKKLTFIKSQPCRPGS